jgi:hypothetical protein
MTEKRKTKEGFTRMWASHLAFIVRGPRGGPYTLCERYNKKRKLGVYHSLRTLERGIERHSDRLKGSAVADSAKSLTLPPKRRKTPVRPHR